MDMLREDGIPARVDPSSLGSLSRATQSQLGHALRYLGLVDQGGIPQESLYRLVEAGDDARQQVLRELLEASYGFLLGEERGRFSLANATDAQLSEKFRQAGVTGDTVRKSQTFFLFAARDAGLTISRYIRMVRERGFVAQTTSRPRTTQRGKREGLAPSPAVEERYVLPLASALGEAPAQAPSPEPVLRPAILVQMLIAKFPSFNPSWSSEAQVKWFEAFDRLMAMVDKYMGGG